MKPTLALASILAISSCSAPGERSAQSTPTRPDQIHDFSVLYAQNCAACHGPNGGGGVSVEFANPVYLAIADETVMRRAASDGRPGTPMSAFAQKSGGPLTDAQIDILVSGIRGRWSKPNILGNATPPPYAARSPGNAAHGETVYNTNCGTCHGLNGHSGPVGSIIDPTFLALVSDQYLRTTAIAGIPTLGMPDWRAHPQPLDDADVTDVVAWLVSHRAPTYVTQANSPGAVQ